MKISFYHDPGKEPETVFLNGYVGFNVGKQKPGLPLSQHCRQPSFKMDSILFKTSFVDASGFRLGCQLYVRYHDPLHCNALLVVVLHCSFVS